MWEWNGIYTIGVVTIFRQHLTQAKVRGKRAQFFILTVLSEVYESCCRSQFHSMTLKLFFGYLEEGTAINLFIF